jgi:hypothetical protein
MIEVADVFRRFAADYVSAHGASMLPSHRRAIEDILHCRTAALGGQVWRCKPRLSFWVSLAACWFTRSSRPPIVRWCQSFGQVPGRIS